MNEGSSLQQQTATMLRNTYSYLKVVASLPLVYGMARKRHETVAWRNQPGETEQLAQRQLCRECS
jgi:hypothetical protein